MVSTILRCGHDLLYAEYILCTDMLHRPIEPFIILNSNLDMLGHCCGTAAGL